MPRALPLLLEPNIENYIKLCMRFSFSTRMATVSGLSPLAVEVHVRLLGFWGKPFEGLTKMVPVTWVRDRSGIGERGR